MHGHEFLITLCELCVLFCGWCLNRRTTWQRECLHMSKPSEIQSLWPISFWTFSATMSKKDDVLLPMVQTTFTVPKPWNLITDFSVLFNQKTNKLVSDLAPPALSNQLLWGHVSLTAVSCFAKIKEDDENVHQYTNHILHSEISQKEWFVVLNKICSIADYFHSMENVLSFV